MVALENLHESILHVAASPEVLSQLLKCSSEPGPSAAERFPYRFYERSSKPPTEVFRNVSSGCRQVIWKRRAGNRPSIVPLQKRPIKGHANAANRLSGRELGPARTCLTAPDFFVDRERFRQLPFGYNQVDPVKGPDITGWSRSLLSVSCLKGAFARANSGFRQRKVHFQRDRPFRESTRTARVAFLTCRTCPITFRPSSTYRCDQEKHRSCTAPGAVEE